MFGIYNLFRRSKDSRFHSSGTFQVHQQSRVKDPVFEDCEWSGAIDFASCIKRSDYFIKEWGLEDWSDFVIYAGEEFLPKSHAKRALAVQILLHEYSGIIQDFEKKTSYELSSALAALHGRISTIPPPK